LSFDTNKNWVTKAGEKNPSVNMGVFVLHKQQTLLTAGLIRGHHKLIKPTLEYVHNRCMFWHSMGAIIREPSQWLKWCSWNSPLCTARSHTCACIKITIKMQKKPPTKF